MASQIARSDQPLYQTRNRPVSWTVVLTDPDGAAIDLTGATAETTLVTSTARIALDVAAPLDATGVIVATGARALVANLPLGRVNEFVLTVTDSQGAVTDYVWPVIGETP